MNLLEIIARGGFLMIFITLCSLIAVAVIIEKLLSLRKASINTKHFLLRLKNLLVKAQMSEAVDYCARTPGPLANVLRKGIARRARNKKEMEETISNAAKEEIFYLERRLGVLATIAGVAPLLGFLGTVTGMIRAFMEIQRLGGNVNSTVLAGGIWEALMTTAAGLIVGIPTFIFYNWLLTKVQKVVFEMETGSIQIIDLLFTEQEDEYEDRKKITEHI